MFNTDPFSLIILFVGLSLLPFMAMIATSYLKLVVVISLIRNALGIQSIPPNMVVNALALILTFYIMAPCMERSWAILEGQRGQSAVQKVPTARNLQAAAEPFREFLKAHASDRNVNFFARSAERLWATDDQPNAEVDRNSFFILVPAFAVTELSSAFQIGFLIYLPFIAIDIIVSNILLAMGMMMVSPMTISLPFKLLLFVLVDGWTRLIQGLILTY